MKYKVLIAEDEPYILKSIKLLILQTHLGFEVVGDASNGYEALGKTKMLKPDVIFTDIRMPLLNGLSLLEQLAESDANSIPVIISGHQDFDYAKKAIKLGVYDYILKPVDPDLFENLLNDIYIRLENKYKQSQLENLKRIVETHNTVSNEDLSVLFPDGEYYYMLCCAGPFLTSPTAKTMLAGDFWKRNNLFKLASKSMPEYVHFWKLDGECENEKILIASIQDKEHNNHKEINNLFFQIHNMLCTDSIPITTLTGYAGSNLSSFGQKLQMSRIKLNKNIIFTKSSFIAEQGTGSIESGEDVKIFEDSFEKVIKIQIYNKQYEHVKHELDKLLKYCVNTDCSQIKLEYVLKRFLGLFYNSFNAVPENISVELDMQINELISCSNSYKAIYNGMCKMIDYLASSTETEDAQKTLIDEVESYIKSNYSKPINVQAIADQFGITASHLSRTFKKAKGVTPNGYIITLRLEKAKELLIHEPDLTLKNISEIIGFNDSYYFSKVFKSSIGINPSKYRNIHHL